MPSLNQGDIFAAAVEHQCELTIVFGHIGFNEMTRYWQDFAATQLKLANVHDPLSGISGRPVEFRKQQWLWYVPDGENHGLTTSQLATVFAEALTWIGGTLVELGMTKGVANIDHATDTTATNANFRAQFLIDLATSLERDLEVTVNPINLNDVIVRTDILVVVLEPETTVKQRCERWVERWVDQPTCLGWLS